MLEEGEGASDSSDYVVVRVPDPYFLGVPEAIKKQNQALPPLFSN